MIIIKESKFIKDNVFRRYNKKIGMCSHCNKELIFFDIPPVTCCYCNTPLLNMCRMLVEQGYRVDYHFGANNL